MATATFERILQDLLASISLCGLDRPNRSSWSLCELQIGDPGLEMLQAYFASLDAQEAQRCLAPWRLFNHDIWSIPFPCGLGLIFLLLAAETARRQAREGAVWPAVRDGISWQEETAAVLFVQGQPNSALREAMEQAAVCFRLRHVFDREGVQAWLTTVYLQFGFTQRGFPLRLPEWLCGYNHPQAIAHLLNPGDQRLYCAKFDQLWQDLRQFRRNNLTEEALQRRLQESFWVLPAWANELVTAAKAQAQRWDIGDGGTTTGAESVEIEPVFLSDPRLHWSHNQPPTFRQEICNLAGLDLPGDFYRLRMGGCDCARLTRQEDGSFAVAPTAEFDVEGGPPTSTAEIVDPRAVDVPRTAEARYWDEGEEVNIFELPSGRRVKDAWAEKLSADRDYALLLSGDLTLYPPPADTWPWTWPAARTGAGERKLWRVDRTELAQLEVRLDGEVFWTPYLNYPPPRPGRLAGVEVTIHGQPSADGTVFLQARTAARVVSARANGQSTGLSPLAHGVTQVGPLALRWPGSWRLDLVLRPETGPLQRGFVPVSVPLPGLYERGLNGQWMPRPVQVLSTHEGDTRYFGVGLPPAALNTATRPWVLLEGNVNLAAATPWTRAGRTFGRLRGWGAPLTLRHEIFNAADPGLPLASEVVDHGVFEPLSAYEPQGQWLRLWFWDELQLDGEHTLIVWDCDGTVTAGPISEHALADGRELHLHLPGGMPWAVALAFRGARLGTWWHGDWTQRLPAVGAEQAAATAALIRWFKLPVLRRKWRHEIKEFVRRWPEEVLRVWLDDSASGFPGLQLGPDHAGWATAVRALLWNATGFERAPDAILESLAPQPSTGQLCEELAAACWRLHEISPLFMGRILQAYLGELPPRETVLRSALRTALESSFAHLPAHRLAYFLRATEERMLSDISREMQKDSFFVDGILRRSLTVLSGGRLSDAEKNNLQWGLNSDVLRRLLALRVVAEVFRPPARAPLR